MEWVKFRDLERSDQAMLYQTCWAEEHEEYVADLIERALKIQQENRGGARVAVVNNSVCAFGLLTQWPQVGEISDLVVRAEYRGAGIGTALIQQLTEFAQQIGISSLEIGAISSNIGALALYERVGFTRHRTFDIHINAKLQPIIYLRKQLLDSTGERA
jgi:ribosomal protein S18 acetylase RimI-like enzyme